MDLTVGEVRTLINGKKSSTTNPSRFNRPLANALAKAIVNDPDYKREYVKYRNNELLHNDADVSKDFRNFIRKLLVQLGIDDIDAKAVMDKNFKFDNLDFLYQLECAHIQEYIEAGGRFEFLPTEEFEGSIYMKEVPRKEEEVNSFNPMTGEDIGKYHVVNEKHKMLCSRSRTPKWLRKRMKVVE